MGHLWQRFLLACALLVGLAIGVGATVFGYSNLETVNVHWSVFHLEGVPLWTVAVVPLVVVLVLGTIYHWLDGLHHFTEHMRHRHRVRELEAEITRLREHLDHVLEMPRGDRATQPVIAEGIEEKGTAAPSLPAAAAEPEREPEPEPDGVAAEETAAVADAEPEKKPSSDRKKRSRIIMETEPEPAPTNGVESEPAVPALKEG